MYVGETEDKNTPAVYLWEKVVMGSEDLCLLSLTLAGVTVVEVHCCNRLLSRGNRPLCSCNLRPGHQHYTHCHTRHEYPAGCHGNRTPCHKEEGGKWQLKSQNRRRDLCEGKLRGAAVQYNLFKRLSTSFTAIVWLILLSL